MLELVLGPLWFHNYSIGIEIISAIVLMLVASRALYFFHISKSVKWLLFGGAFALLTAAFAANATLLVGLQAKQFITSAGGVLSVGIFSTAPSSMLFFLATVTGHFLLLFGFYLLYFTYQPHSRLVLAFAAYMLFVLMYFSSAAYFIFHLTALVLILMVSTELLARYRRHRHKATKMLFHTFLILSLSQLLFIGVALSPLFFVAAEIVQLLGFVALLGAINLMRHGKTISTPNN